MTRKDPGPPGTMRAGAAQEDVLDFFAGRNAPNWCRRAATGRRALCLVLCLALPLGATGCGKDFLYAHPAAPGRGAPSAAVSPALTPDPSAAGAGPPVSPAFNDAVRDARHARARGDAQVRQINRDVTAVYGAGAHK